jgi:hypothetical protein
MVVSRWLAFTKSSGHKLIVPRPSSQQHISCFLTSSGCLFRHLRSALRNAVLALPLPSSSRLPLLTRMGNKFLAFVSSPLMAHGLRLTQFRAGFPCDFFRLLHTHLFNFSGGALCVIVMHSDSFWFLYCLLVALEISLLSPRTFLLNRYKHQCKLSRLLSLVAEKLPACLSLISPRTSRPPLYCTSSLRFKPKPAYSLLEHPCLGFKSLPSQTFLQLSSYKSSSRYIHPYLYHTPPSHTSLGASRVAPLSRPHLKSTPVASALTSPARPRQALFVRMEWGFGLRVL